MNKTWLQIVLTCDDVIADVTRHGTNDRDFIRGVFGTHHPGLVRIYDVTFEMSTRVASLLHSNERLVPCLCGTGSLIPIDAEHSVVVTRPVGADDVTSDKL